jgi:hypothetical protein
MSLQSEGSFFEPVTISSKSFCAASALSADKLLSAAKKTIMVLRVPEVGLLPSSSLLQPVITSSANSKYNMYL